MDANTTMKLTQQIRVVNALTNIIDIMAESGQLEEFDRNVVSLRRGLKEAHDSFQRLIMGQEHPEALAARQVGAETLRKLGYAEAPTTDIANGEDEGIPIPLDITGRTIGEMHPFIPMTVPFVPFTDGEENTGRMHINPVPLSFARQHAAEMAAMEPLFEDDGPISVDASKMVPGQHRLAAFMRGLDAARRGVEKPDLGEITERFSMPDGYPKEADMQHIQPTPFIPIKEFSAPSPSDPDWNSPEDAVYDKGPTVPGSYTISKAAWNAMRPMVNGLDEPADNAPVDYRPNHQGDILYGDVAGLHEAPCTRCESDGHATCQHQDGKEDI